MDPRDQIGAQILDARIKRARSKFDDFVEFVLRDETGEPIKLATIHKVWRLHVEHCWKAGKYPAILAPWAHGKSIINAVARPGYELGRNTNLRVKVVCNDDKTAMKRVSEVARVIQTPQYRMVFPNVQPAQAHTTSERKKWTQHEIILRRTGAAIDPSLGAYGVFATGVGGRADLLIFDDIVDERNAIMNPTMRKKVISALDNTWMSRLEPAGRPLYIGTMWHLEDCSHEILRRPAWCVLRMWVSDDFERLEMEVYNPDDQYPLPRMQSAVRLAG